MELEERQARMSGILAECRKAAPSATVFGSCAEGSAQPGDIDLMVEADSRSREAAALLEIARRHYGWLDVFLFQPAGPMLVRNPWCTGWDRAKRANGIRKAVRERGVPISAFVPAWEAPGLPLAP